MLSTPPRRYLTKFMSICKTHFIWSNKNYGEVFSNCWAHCSLLKDAVKLDFVTTGTRHSCSFMHGVFLFAVKPILQPSCILLNWLTDTLEMFLLLRMLFLQKYDIQPICDTKKMRKSDKSPILLEKCNDIPADRIQPKVHRRLIAGTGALLVRDWNMARIPNAVTMQLSKWSRFSKKLSKLSKLSKL